MCGVSKHSAMVIADSFSTGRVFAVVRADGTLSEWYPLVRGFGQGSKGGGLYYNSSSREVSSRIYPCCSCICLLMIKRLKGVALLVVFELGSLICSQVLIQLVSGSTSQDWPWMGINVNLLFSIVCHTLGRPCLCVHQNWRSGCYPV